MHQKLTYSEKCMLLAKPPGVFRVYYFWNEPTNLHPNIYVNLGSSLCDDWHRSTKSEGGLAKTEY